MPNEHPKYQKASSLEGGGTEHGPLLPSAAVVEVRPAALRWAYSFEFSADLCLCRSTTGAPTAACFVLIELPFACM